MSSGAEKLKTNKSIAILDAAERGGYGIVSVVCYNLEEIIATARAAEAKKSPAMILLFPWALTQFKSHLVNLAADVCKSAKVPMSLHLDHCLEYDLVKYAASLPFDSIMVDMSHYEKDENLKLTKELTEYCHERGIATEAEPGRIEGGEDGLKDTADLEGVLTTPEQALEFVATGIDFLAPAFGNIHGEYGARGPRGWLEFDRLEKVRKAVEGKVKLVLHGTNAFDQALFQQCVGHGVSKINVNKQLIDPWKKMMNERHEKGFLPITKLMEDSIDIFQKEVERLMDECGSSGKA
ncbi:aldolase [Hyaloscypha hepaticicola]|uniref:Fructose-bisphosphate aldolase n=1 Tax=Hyaloscypha hepaticicola TaxID=2082293 RepID=A0A2J6PTS4_9HELO|nr:aldolase [Hyaloscypha hepaticicola]